MLDLFVKDYCVRLVDDLQLVLEDQILDDLVNFGVLQSLKNVSVAEAGDTL